MRVLAKKTEQDQSVKSSLLIIHGGNNQLCVDSRDIAKEFGRQHKNVLQTLDDLLADGTISRLESKPSNYTKRGKQYRHFELNEAGFLKAMPFIGGHKPREGQKRLVDEFLRLRRQLDRQSKQRETQAYQVARISGKDSRGILTDAIKQFVDYARSQGSQHADRYYKNITDAAYRAMVDIEQPTSEVRELLTAIQLSTLSTLELIAAQALTEGMAGQQPYKAIYQTMKTALEDVVVGRAKILGN